MRAGRFALAMLLLLTPTVAAAIPKAPTEAEVLFGRGVEAFEAGRYESAAALLSQAYALEPDDRLAFNTALAYERAGRTTEAVTWYRLAFEGEDSSLKEQAEAAIGRLVKGGSQPGAGIAAERAPEAALTVRLGAPVSGARLCIDGGHPLALPATLAMTPGAHIIEVSAPAYQRWEETVSLAAQEVREVVVVLRPVASPPGVPRWWFGAGVAGASTAAGIGFYLAAADDFEKANRLAKVGQDRVGFDRAQSDGRSAASLSDASYGLAAVAAVVTGVLWWMEQDGQHEIGGVSVGPLLGPSEAGVLGSWRP